MSDSVKEWKLLQGVLGLLLGCSALIYVGTARFDAREWFPFLPTPATPDTLIFHIDAMRRQFALHQYKEALQEADRVLAKQKDYQEARQVRTAALLRVGRFQEAESELRVRVGANKNDLAARLDLALALRGQGRNEVARDVLLRLLKHPLLSPQQKDLAFALLNSAEGPSGTFFADQPPLTPPTPLSSPSPLTSPGPTLPTLTIRPPDETRPVIPRIPSMIPNFGWTLPPPARESSSVDPVLLPVTLPGGPGGSATPDPGTETTPTPVPEPTPTPVPTTDKSTEEKSTTLPTPAPLPRRLLPNLTVRPTPKPKRPTTAKPARTTKKGTRKTTPARRKTPVPGAAPATPRRPHGPF